MRAWFRMFFVISGLGAAISSIEAAQIKISGHIATPVTVADGAAIHDSVIPYWELLDMERAMPDGLRVVGPYHYGASFPLTRSFTHRNVFRYYDPEYSKIRYPRLRILTQHERLGGRQRYQPGIQYTGSFRAPTGFRTRLRYGFQ
jgi:hypothetical protein